MTEKQEELRTADRVEERERVDRRIDSIRSSLDREQWGRVGHQPDVAPELRPGQDQGSTDSPVVPRALVRGSESSLCAVRLSRNGDPPAIDKAVQRAFGGRARRKQLRDDETHVAGLVHDVGLIWPARCVCVPEREDRRGNQVTRTGPGPQQSLVTERRRREPVPEDDQWPRAIPSRSRRIPEMRRHRPSDSSASRQPNRSRLIDQMKDRRERRPVSPALRACARRWRRRRDTHCDRRQHEPAHRCPPHPQQSARCPSQRTGHSKGIPFLRASLPSARRP
jgi:hypothetical protein